jgi:uncharacterized protein (DUF2267 family)
MTTTGITSLDSSVNNTEQWLDEIRQELHFESEEQAWKAWKAVAHALRDRLTVEEAAHFAAQLPTVLRGLYYEQYHPADKPLKIRNIQDFFEQVEKGLDSQTDPALTDPERITTGVLSVIHKRVTEGELEDIRDSMPEGLQRLFAAAEG